MKKNLINDYSNVYADNSVCVTMDGNSIPPIYFSPNYMVIFTQPNEDGWTLSKGDEFSIASVDKGIHNKTTKYGLPTY